MARHAAQSVPMSATPSLTRAVTVSGRHGRRTAAPSAALRGPAPVRNGTSLAAEGRSQGDELRVELGRMAADLAERR